jgi:uncharacterized BrkB/YihY/UPF0761 family membrane protein
MEKYRKTLTRNVIRAALLCIFIMVLYVLVELIETSALAGFLPKPLDSPEKETIAFFRLGLISGLICVALFYIVRSIHAIRNPEKLEQMYIKDNDEREKLIKQKTGLSTYIITLFCLAFSIAVSASYNLVVCKTLIAAAYGMIFIFVGCNFYYRKKY